MMCVQQTFKPGDQAPEGYLDWHEWAETQHKSGLRQKECGRCGKWKYPQQMISRVDICEMQSHKGHVTLKTFVCNNCNAAPDQNDAE
jgi:polyferredoxin